MKNIFTKKNRYLIALLASTAMLMSGCNSSDSDDEEALASTKTVTIAFEATVGDETLQCSEGDSAKTYANVGTTDETITLKDFRFFVSDVKMVRADGTKETLKLNANAYQYQGEASHVALLDFEDNSGNCIDRGNSATTNMVVEGNVSNETYAGIEFTVGVPFDLNHVEFPDIQVLNHSSMAWKWAAGRKFVKMEAQPESNTSLVWNFHLGSTGCQDTDSDGITNECAQPNRITIALDDFDAESNTVKIDYKALLAANDVSKDLGGAKGCMSGLTDPECSHVLTTIGLDVTAMEGVCANGGDCTLSQDGVFTKGTK